MTPNFDQNLLFGIVALQMDFVRREQLVAATSAWLCDKSRKLEDILVEQGAISEDDRGLLAPLVARQLLNHNGDATQGLTALSSLGSVAEELRSLGDDQILETLSVLQIASRSATIDLGYKESDPTDQRTLRYRILKPHAKGGLGEVSIAQDTEVNRTVALKEIRSEYANDAESQARFILEAEVTGGLEHPGIVPVYGLGRYEDGRPFYAMRFIKGDSLQEAAKRMHERQPFDYMSVDFRKLLGRFIDVCEAIEYAHSRGVLHRDLKPGNIMLGKYGETLVVDWGLARARGRDNRSHPNDETTLRPSSGTSSAPTQLGHAIGTPAFMPPEQAAGKLDELGPASDVYSLGATLYFLLTAQQPVVANSLRDVLSAVQIGDFPAPRAVITSIPKPLEAICLKAMSLKPSDRYTSPSALSDDVQRWLADEPISACVEPVFARAMRWVRKHQTMAASVAVLLLVGLFALSLSTVLVNMARQETQEALAAERLARIEADKQRSIANDRTIEAQAQRVIADTANRENQRIASRLAFDRAREVSENGNPQLGLLWFVRAMELANEEDIAFHELVLRNLAEWAGETSSLLTHFDLKKGGSSDGIRISRDGEFLYICNHELGVIQWQVATQSSRLFPFPELDVTFDSPLRGAPAIDAPIALSEDETTCVAGLGNKVYFWQIDSGLHIGQPVEVDGAITSIDYHPTEEKIAVACKEGTCFLIDVRTRKAISAPLKHGAEIRRVAFRPDGEELLTAGYDKAVRRWKSSTLEKVEPAFIEREFMGVTAAAWSPDGRTIIAGSFSGWRVWDVEKGEVIHTEQTAGPTTAIAYRDDGQLFAVSTTEGKVDVRDAKTFAPSGHPLLMDDGAHFLCFDSSKRLTSVGANPFLLQWKLPESSIKAVAMGTKDANRMDLCSSVQRVAIAGMKGLLVLCDTETGQRVGDPLDFGQPISCVKFNDAGDKILVNGFRGSSRVYATEGLEQIGQTISLPGMVAGDFVDDQHVAITIPNDGVTRVYNFLDGQPVGTEMSQPIPLCIAIKGDKMAVIGAEGTLVIWSLKTRETISPIVNLQFQASALVFSPNGKYLACGGSGRTVDVLDAASAETVVKLHHSASVKDVCFSPDSRLLVTSAFDQTVRLWDVATGQRVGPDIKGLMPTRVQFDTSGRVFFPSEIETGKLCIWPRPGLPQGDIERLRRWTATRTGLELEKDGNFRVLSLIEWAEAAKY